MRFFVAIDVNEQIRNKVIEIQNKLKHEDYKIKFVEPENLHFTLKFLGEVKDKDINFVCEQIEKVSRKIDPFTIYITGLRYFGSPSYIKVIWANVKNGDKLVEIFTQLNKNLHKIRKDEHEYKPHLTIGRILSISNKNELLKRIKSLENVNFGELNIRKIILKESKLTTKGPIYNDYKVFNL